MLHAKFHGNGMPVPEKTFEGYLPYLGVAPSWSCDQHHFMSCHFLVPESFLTKFGSELHNSF